MWEGGKEGGREGAVGWEVGEREVGGRRWGGGRGGRLLPPLHPSCPLILLVMILCVKYNACPLIPSLPFPSPCHSRLTAHPSLPLSLLPSHTLSQDWTPKLIDFGLAKEKEGESHVTTRVMGTMGYLDPDYMESGDSLARAFTLSPPPFSHPSASRQCQLTRSPTRSATCAAGSLVAAAACGALRR